MSVNDRQRRVNEQLKEVIAERLVDLKDPRIGFVTVTDVRVSADFAHADVFYTELGQDADAKAATAAGLASAVPLLRRELGARLRIRRIPDLHFTHDPALDRGLRIEQLLDEMRGQDHQ